jgi:hypothetical protein
LSFEPRRDEVTGEWRKLHNEELHNLYSSQAKKYKVKVYEMGKACSTNGEKRNTYVSYLLEIQRKRDH